LVGATAVVSTLGGFGNEEQMKRINGEANIIAVNAAKEYGKCDGCDGTDRTREKEGLNPTVLAAWRLVGGQGLALLLSQLKINTTGKIAGWSRLGGRLDFWGTWELILVHCFIA